MIEFLQALASFLITLGVLITFHEFGHFLVARKCDVKILRFSVGFGKPIWMRKFGEDNSEFCIAAIPLGGYVKMLDEREDKVPEDELHRAFNNQPLRQRVAIVLAGPVFNFIFTAFAYWLVFMLGVSGLRPIVGEVEPNSLTEKAGIVVGDEIIEVDEKRTKTWVSVIDGFVLHVINEQSVEIVLRGLDGIDKVSSIDMSQISVDDMANGSLLVELGIQPKRQIIPAVVGEIIAGGAAERAKLVPGDKIISVNNAPIENWTEWVNVVRENPGQVLCVEILRDGRSATIELIPDVIFDKSGKQVGRIEAAMDNNFERDKSLITIESYSFLPALYKAGGKTAEMSVMTLRILGKMIVGKASVKNLAGPISIAKYAGQSARLGMTTFLSFLAMISVSLGVLNLLPIPLLDGGHLMYYFVETLKGSQVSEAAQIVGQQVGLAMLLCLTGIALYNDILRLIS